MIEMMEGKNFNFEFKFHLEDYPKVGLREAPSTYNARLAIRITKKSFGPDSWVENFSANEEDGKILSMNIQAKELLKKLKLEKSTKKKRFVTLITGSLHGDVIRNIIGGLRNGLSFNNHNTVRINKDHKCLQEHFQYKLNFH